MIASEEEQERRWNICLECVHLNGKTCGICGCHMPAKVKLLYTKCPKSKWVGETYVPFWRRT
jgi:hypothetical protein